MAKTKAWDDYKNILHRNWQNLIPTEVRMRTIKIPMQELEPILLS